MLGLQILIFLIQNILTAEVAEMKISTVPQLGDIRNQINSYEREYKNDHFESNQNINDVMPRNALKRGIKNYPFKAEVFKKPRYEAAHGSYDDLIVKSSRKNKLSSRINQNVNNTGNNTSKSQKYKRRNKDSLKKSAKNNFHSDVDSYYDSELIRKLSDNHGKLPQSMKLVIPADKDPIVVYNATDDGASDSLKLAKRDVKSEKGKVYYDYNYYDDQVPDESPLSSGGREANEQNMTSGKMLGRGVKTANSSVGGGVQGSTGTGLRPFAVSGMNGSHTSAAEGNSSSMKQSAEHPEGTKSDGGLSVRSAIVKAKGTFNDRIKSAVKRKETCPSPESGGSQFCHPSWGLPKNPGIPPLPNQGRDPEYERLLRGEISENVIKEIMDRAHRNPLMVSELGMTDLDLSELKEMFREAKPKERKECCLRLRGEFSCFLNWLLSTEPARVKRSESGPGEAGGSTTCDQFPKFSLMSGGDYCKPTPQYEKLVRKVEEYREDNNL